MDKEELFIDTILGILAISRKTKIIIVAKNDKKKKLFDAYQRICISHQTLRCVAMYLFSECWISYAICQPVLARVKF